MIITMIIILYIYNYQRPVGVKKVSLGGCSTGTAIGTFVFLYAGEIFIP